MSYGFAIHVPDPMAALRERVAELEAEVDFLRREQRADAEQRVIDAIRRRYKIQPARAMLLAMLFARAPHAVSSWALLDALPAGDHARDRSDDVVKVHICMIRHALGADAIETIHRRGYCLTEAGRQRVGAAIAEAGGPCA
jgi:DNA-binding winged helix-turn-helix (wHTH) protein